MEMFNSFIARDIHDLVTIKNQSYHFYPNPADHSVYWILLKNIKPVYETHLNIHQLAENAKLLEERVLTQEGIISKHEEIIKQQQKTINTQSEQIQRIQETISQITGHVFHQDTEMNTIYALNNFMMYGKNCSTHWLYSEENEEKDDVSEFGSMPSLLYISDDECSEEKLSERGFHRNSKMFCQDSRERMRFTADFCDNV